MDFTQAMAQVQKNKEDQNTSTFGDVVDLAQQGALQTISGVANFVGAEDTARSLEQWANEQYDTLTPEMQEAMAKDIVNDDMSFGEGAKDWRTWLGTASNVLGGMAVTMVPGGAAGKAASLAGAGTKLAQGASVGTNALLNLAAGNGGQGFNVQKDVENLDFDALMESPKFRQYVVEESDNGASDDEALNNARERLAGEIGDSVKSDFTLGAVNLIAETVGDQAFGKLLKGSIGKTIKGAIGKGMLTEGGTEAIQGGTEQYRSNVNQNEVMGVEGDNMEGVGANALESGLVGAVIGGGAGAPGGVAGRMRRRNFENKIESVINSEAVGQLRGAGKTDAEIETMLKSKIEDKALSMGFDANESQALAHQAVAAAFGTAPPAAERHATEDQAEAVAQPQQRPEGAERRDQMTQEARQARQQEDNTWSQQNGYPDPRDFGLTQEDAELLIDPPVNLMTASGKINPKAPKELKQAYQIAMGRRGAQDYINTVFNNSQPQREAYNQSFQPQQPEPVVSQPDMLEQTQQPQPEAQQPAQAPEQSEDHAQLASVIQKGDLGFAEQKAEQDDSFKQGLLQAFEYSPSAVLQIAELRRNGKMNEEQAISALQRVINSVELNVPDQLNPSEQETKLRNQQAQERNAQQQLEIRGQREQGFQPNVEETPEFQRNQARLLQGMQQRAQTKGAAGGPQFNGERDVSPLATGIEDQYQSDAPQVEFDRWSEVQPGDVNRDERFTQDANEYELNPEPEQQARYREPLTVAQEPAQAPEKEEPRQPKRNKRQEKKAAKKQKEIEAAEQKAQDATANQTDVVYSTEPTEQKTEIARQIEKITAECEAKRSEKTNQEEKTKQVEAPPVKPKTLKPKKLGDDVPGVTLQGTANDRRVHPNDEKGEPLGTYFKVVKDTENKQFVIYGIAGDVRDRVGYGKGTLLAKAVDETNSRVSDYADIIREAHTRINDNKKSNQTAERKTFNKRWDDLGTKERRDLVESAMPDSSPKLKTALSRSTGESLELVEYNKLEAQMAKADNAGERERTHRKNYSWNAVELARNYSAEELDSWVNEIRSDPQYKNENGGIHLLNKKGQKIVDALTWAVTYHHQEKSKIEKASQETDINPTDAQKEAGNYKKGTFSIHGLTIALENPKGSERKGVDDDGKSWSVTMKNHYGYIKRTEGADGDAVDVFVGPNENSKVVYIIDQVNPKTGEFDEHKVMIGFTRKDTARKAYLDNYQKGWKGLGEFSVVKLDDFKKWLKDGDLTKPYSSDLSSPTPPDGGGSKPKAEKPPAEATSTTKAKKGRTRPSGARNYLKAISSFTDGEYSQAEAIELIDQFIEDKPSLEAEFNGYRKNDIGTLFARLGQYIDVTLRKDALVRRAVDNIGSQFSAIKSTSGMFVVNSPEKIRAELAAMSESEYNELAANRVQKRKDQEAEAERKKKALDNPQTLDDYQAYARANGGTIDAFDNDQLAEFDRLYTENQVERREAQEARELERKAEVKAVETDGSIELSKIDVLNEAKGEQRYGAAFSEVDSDTFNSMRAKAKQLGGWYARAYKPKNLPARFDFKTESARDDFLSVMGGMNVDQSERVQEKAQEKTQTKQEKQVEGLRQKAAGLQAKADESNNADRLTNTARRASFAASAAAKADRQEAQANILNKIADGVASGKFKLLGNLTDISQLEELTNIMNRVKWDMPEEMREKYAYRDQSGNWHLKPETKFNDVARFIRFPAPQSTPQSLEYIANEIEGIDGFKMTAKSIRSNIKGMGENDRVNLNGARWDKVVEKLRKLARAKNLNIYRAEHINELFKSQDRLTRMGITGDITLRHALREYEQANAGKMTTRKEKTRLQQLTEKIEDIVRGNRNAFNDFFPTPDEEAKQVVDLAEIESGMRVLEPNAGMGHIADQIAALNGVDLDVGELAHTLSEMLEEKGHNVVAGDFLEYHAGEIYDRIVMNPPFSNDADIHHINHALSMLKDGGRLVAITSSMAGDRGNTTNKNFRKYLDEVGAEEIPLEAGTFTKSLNPTNVATKIIVIDKPADVDYDDIRFSKTSEVEAKPARGMRTELVADAAQNWINDYDGLKGVNVTVVQTMEDLYNLVETEDNAPVKGAWLSGDNRVVLVAENLTNAADVRKTLRHELIAHNGLYGNLSNAQQDKLTKQLNSLRGTKALKQIFADVDKAYKTAPENVKAEEVIARIAENEQSAISRFADRVMTWVIGALRRSGIIGQETVSLAEIRTMLNNVDKNLRKPNGKTTLSNVVRFSKVVSDMDEDAASQGDPTLSVADALAADNERFYQQMLGKVKNGFTSKIFDSMKNGGWSLLNLRQMAEVGRRRVGQEVGNILDSYVDNKDLFTTRKSELIEKVHKQAEALNKFRRDEPEQAEKTFSLLHDATLADVDPSQEYVDQTPEKKELLKTLQRLYQEYGGSQNKRGQEVSDEMKAIKKDIKNEPQLRVKHAALREQFNKLSPEGQKTFNDVRDHYISQREEMDKALENRIAELAMAGSMKAGENTYHRYMMEKARLGFYVPLSRFGTYWLDVMDANGERRFQMYETESEMKADAKKLESAGYKFQNDREADLGTGQMRMGAKLNESRGLSGASASFVSDVVKSISGAQTNDKVKEQLTDEIYQMYLQTMPDRSIRRAFIHRKGVAGYTEDAARVLADQGVKQANQQAKLETEKQFSDLIDHLKTATDKSNNVSAGRLYNEMLQRHDWMLNPQRAAWAQKLTGFGFLWQIGISPASAMLNLGQNWQVALPIIGAKYGFKGTAAEMTKLSAQWAKTFAAKKKVAGMRGEIDTTNGILGDVLNDEERAALRHAIKIGAIDVTQMADLTGMAEQDSKNYTGKMAKVNQFIGAPFHWAEVMNREVAFLTAYRMAKAGGASKQESLDYATKATWDSHFDYSSRNRARFMQGDVAAVALQFRQYSQNMTYYLFRNFFDALKGADAETKRQARRQLAGTFGVTFAIGGLNALPVATLAAIANVAYALGGDDNEPWDAETEFKGALADMFGDEIGKHIYYGTMPSVSSRINIDLLRMWVQESDSQDATSWLENMSQQAMGASFGTAMSFARGANYLSEGQYLRAAEATTPKWIKDVLRTARYASEGGTVTNRNGEVLIGDVDPLEYTGQLLGFTPSRLVMTYDRNSALKGYEKEATRRRSTLMNAYWLATRTKDKDGQRAALRKIQVYNQSDWGKARPITAKVIQQSVKQHRRMMGKSVNGAHFNEKYLKLLQEQQYW